MFKCDRPHYKSVRYLMLTPGPSLDSRVQTGPDRPEVKSNEVCRKLLNNHQSGERMDEANQHQGK